MLEYLSMYMLLLESLTIKSELLPASLSTITLVIADEIDDRPVGFNGFPLRGNVFADISSAATMYDAIYTVKYCIKSVIADEI